MELFVAVVVFFGQPLLGALIATISGLRSDRFRRLGIPLVLSTLLYLFLGFSLPYRSGLLEAVPVFMGVIVYVFIIAIITPEVDRVQGPAALVACLAMVAVSFTSTTRVARAMQMAWSCDGLVSNVYRSNNHGAPTLEVRSRRGDVMKLEGVDAALWNACTPGKSHLQKNAWDAFGLLDGTRVRVVQSRASIFDWDNEK